ncbi:hypothetical protein AAW52_12080 [Vibrio diabolicus]|nr:hypothetical protein AAW52_12080 [Vibrio diabolicus]
MYSHKAGVSGTTKNLNTTHNNYLSWFINNDALCQILQPNFVANMLHSIAIKFEFKNANN